MPGFDDLTPVQDRVLRLPDEGRYLVYGPPGTGKTIIALMRAVAMRERGNEPITIMFNRLLNLYCRQVLGQDRSYTPVNTYHAWFCSHYKRRYGEMPPQAENERGQPLNFQYNWEKVIEVCAAQQRIITDPTPLLVDEGQDLPRQFYEYLSLHFPHIMVFADENQMLNEHENSRVDMICDQLGIVRENCFRLKDNMRNTLQIARVAEHFYAGTESGRPDHPTREGSLPQLLKYPDLTTLARHIVTHGERHPESLIAAITTNNANLHRMKDIIQPQCGSRGISFTYYQAGEMPRARFDEPGIILLNLQSMKGLEFDSVFVVDLQDHIVRPNSVAHKMRLYVASSRPLSQLGLCFLDGEGTQLLDIMPEEEVLKRHSLDGAGGLV